MCCWKRYLSLKEHQSWLVGCFPGQQCVRVPLPQVWGGSRVMREHGRFTLSYQAGATLAASAVVPSLISSLTVFPLPGFSQ